MPARNVSAPFHFWNDGGVFAEANLANDATREARADQALDHERFTNRQPSFRVLERDSPANACASGCAIDFTFSEDADVAAVGAFTKRFAIDNGSVEKAQIVFEWMPDLY